MEKEIELLCRVAIDHLHLGQFEPFRAIILSLRGRNPELALSILQTIVSNGGRFPNILFSSSCPSPSLLTWMSTLELLNFHSPTSPMWSFNPQTLRLRAEFCLLVQMLIPVPVKNSEEAEDGDGLGDEKGEVRVLGRILELGFNRLKGDEVVITELNEGSLILDEDELGCLRGLILKHVDVFDALGHNIQKQMNEDEGDDSGMAIMVRREGGKQRVDSEDETKFLGLVQRTVQRAHLDMMKECIGSGDINGAVTHIRFLHLDYGLPEAEYRYPCYLF